MKPVQEKNEEEFRQQIILDVAGLMQPGGALCERPAPKACSMCIEDTWHRLEVTPEQVADLVYLIRIITGDAEPYGDGTTWEGNIEEGTDPRFVNAAGGDYQLEPCPAVNSGTNLAWVSTSGNSLCPAGGPLRQKIGRAWRGLGYQCRRK